jgi:hypothetical protein
MTFLIDEAEKSLSVNIPFPAFPTVVPIKEIRKSRYGLLRHLRNSRRIVLSDEIAELAYKISMCEDGDSQIALGLARRAHVPYDNLFIEWNAEKGLNSLNHITGGMKRNGFQLWKVAEDIFEGIYWIDGGSMPNVKAGEAFMYPVGFIYDAAWRTIELELNEDNFHEHGNNCPILDKYLTRHDKCLNYDLKRS